MTPYKTIEGRASAEIVVKKSRFIATLCHTPSEADALAFIAKVKTEHAQARHNVYAYIIEGGRVRYTDDGEPAQTAGIPTLSALEHAELVNVACVVTRYFGGTLLGTGGLVRAYTDATNAAIERARIIEIALCVDVSVTLAYAQYEQGMHLMNAAGASVVQTDFKEDVFVRARVLAGTEDALKEKLTELTRGQSPITMSEPYQSALERRLNGSMVSGNPSSV